MEKELSETYNYSERQGHIKQIHKEYPKRNSEAVYACLKDVLYCTNRYNIQRDNIIRSTVTDFPIVIQILDNFCNLGNNNVTLHIAITSCFEHNTVLQKNNALPDSE